MERDTQIEAHEHTARASRAGLLLRAGFAAAFSAVLLDQSSAQVPESVPPPQEVPASKPVKYEPYVAPKKEERPQAALDALITRLGDEDFSKREQATKELERLMTPKLYCILSKHREHTDLEIQHRVRVLQEGFCIEYAKVVLADIDPVPWIDSLPRNHSSYWETVQAYLVMGKARPTNLPQMRSAAQWGAYREATYWYVVDMLRRGDDPKDVQNLMRVMLEHEQEYCLTNHYPFPYR